MVVFAWYLQLTISNQSIQLAKGRLGRLKHAYKLFIKSQWLLASSLTTYKMPRLILAMNSRCYQRWHAICDLEEAD